MLEQLNERRESGLLRATPHPTLPLTIWTYTPACQCDHAWDDVTMMARGLVVHDDGHIIARPFPKFFRHDQHQNPAVPHLDARGPWVAYEKYDGSLIVAFRYEGKLVVCTRNCWDNHQTQAAYAMLWGWMPMEAHTHCFELVGPSNQHVVRYSEDALVSLAAFRKDGRQVPGVLVGALSPKVHARGDAGDERWIDLPDPKGLEGYVVYFPETGARVKLVAEWYRRAAKSAEQATPKRVLDLLAAGDDLATAGLPTSTRRDVYRVAYDLLTDHAGDMAACHRLFSERPRTGDRKSLAEYFMRWPNYAPVLFAMLDGKDADAVLWKLLRRETA